MRETFVRVQQHGMSLPISDDDLCADCENLMYCPGDRSLCQKAVELGEWPCVINRDGYAICCRQYARVPVLDSNWVPLPEDTDTTPWAVVLVGMAGGMSCEHISKGGD